MIVSLNLRNTEHVHQVFRCYPRHLYGLAMPYLADYTYSGLLAQGENLYLCAHGNPVNIGHPQEQKRFSPQALADWLIQSVLPCHYVGSLFIAAPGCLPNFIDSLLDCLGQDYSGRIHGIFNLSYNEIKPPHSDEWIAAGPVSIPACTQRKSVSSSAAR